MLTIEVSRIPEEHVEWICDTMRQYTDYATTTIREDIIQSDPEDRTCSVILEGENGVILSQLASLILNKIVAIDYIRYSMYYTGGFKYWVAYIKKEINIIVNQIFNILIPKKHIKL